LYPESWETPSFTRHRDSPSIYPVTEPIKDRSHWTIRKFNSHEELRCQQVRDWQMLSGEERRKAAWELVTDYWIGMKEKHPDELRLQRSVTKLTRM
jgi:hypothetical protein